MGFLPLPQPGTSVGPSTVIAVKSGRVFWAQMAAEDGTPGRNGSFNGDLQGFMVIYGDVR